MTGQDTQMQFATGHSAMHMAEGMSKFVFDWWRAQAERLFDETAPWNAGLYIMRRMSDMAMRPVALTEEDRAYKVEAELPGLKPQNLDIRVTDGLLRISGEAGTGNGAAARTMPGMERFEREILLPTNADTEKATAEMHDGRLTVIMPKQPPVREHKVAVKSA